MNYFTFKPPYREKGRTILEVNVLPDKYCPFNCIYCPVDRKKFQHIRTEEVHFFPGLEESLQALEEALQRTRPDLVFLNARGEAVLNQDLPRILEFLRARSMPVRLLSNGYLLARTPYRELADRCEEVVGELKNCREEDFQRTQRPLPGYTLAQYTENLLTFRRQYTGRFLFEATVVKGYNDSPEAVAWLRSFVKELQPDELILETVSEEPFSRKLQVDSERMAQIAADVRSAWMAAVKRG
ncbi:MAG: radical SAM protein [Succiniclasticum sp.]|jgi:wyosine [tRNA(Phe)-imidazoG37] synthetase (radical SAM superfamily)